MEYFGSPQQIALVYLSGYRLIKALYNFTQLYKNISSDLTIQLPSNSIEGLIIFLKSKLKSMSIEQFTFYIFENNFKPSVS